MNTSGEAADQVVRMSLEVGEAALKISGTGAQQLAVILYAVLKEQKKTSGKAKLETLVRSGKPLTVFSIKESDLKKFVQEAKRYGILYCAVRDPKGSCDGMVDIMVKEEDAPRINRIVERFQFATVTEAAITTEILKSREEKAQSELTQEKAQETEKTTIQSDLPSDQLLDDQLLDELFGVQGHTSEEEKTGAETPKNPSLATTEKSHLSEPISKKQKNSAEGTSKPYQPDKKPSVRNELTEIQAARKKAAEIGKRKNKSTDKKYATQKSLQHRQPKAKRKTKKGRGR
jgi:hypothetical protein